MIVIRNVGKTFQVKDGDPVVALQDIDLDVGDKEFVTIVGPSGCGKSTLLKLVVGLLPLTAGEIFIGEEKVAGPYRDVGMVFQQPVLMPWRTVIENILYPVEILRLNDKDYRKVAHDLIELTGLKGFERHKPRQLSGGMQQRVSICRALIYDPLLLLMDEPFGALDAMTREEMGFELLRIWRERKKTILFVTHSIPEAVLLADRVIVFTPRPGRIAKVIPVRLPRPRDAEMEFSPEFREHVREIKDLIFSGRALSATPHRA
ncbi:MAG: ABC transporter ATP-binding protein [Nitrospinota bacterium]